MPRHTVCRVTDVFDGEMKAFEVGKRRVLVARIGENWYAVNDTCSHAEASLAMGELDAEECTVSCPLHSGVFELETGEGVEYPATDPIDVFPVAIEDGEVVVDIG